MPHSPGFRLRNAGSPWFIAAVAAWTLAAVTFATSRLAFERAPTVHVRWAPTVTDPIRARLEQRFALLGGERESGQTWVYFLASTSPENIQALVQHPGVQDTHYIDRLQFLVSPTAARDGPYVTSEVRWLPQGLLAFNVALLIIAIVATCVAAGPAALRALTSVFSPSPAGQPERAATTAALLVLGGALALVGTLYVAQLRIGADESAAFRVGDWLVSYDAGFVRRGLPGSPILKATELLHVRPERVVFWMQTGLYALLSALLFTLARRKRLNVWALAFLFSPAALLFPIYDAAVVGRKDLLFFVVFALYACWMPQPDRVRGRFMAAVLGAATTLTHELFFFYTPYFFVMRMLHSPAPDRSRFRPESWLAAGSLIALLFASTLGSDLRGEEQCAGLLGRGFKEELCNGIMRYPATTIGASMRETAITVRTQPYFLAYPIAAILGTLPLLPLVRTNASVRRRLTRNAGFGVAGAVIFTLPMFVIALDWGRLLNIHLMAVAVLLLAFLLDDRQTPGSFWGIRNAWLRVAILLVIGAYLSGWSIRHCCEDPLRAGVFTST